MYARLTAGKEYRTYLESHVEFGIQRELHKALHLAFESIVTGQKIVCHIVHGAWDLDISIQSSLSHSTNKHSPLSESNEALSASILRALIMHRPGLSKRLAKLPCCRKY